MEHSEPPVWITYEYGEYSLIISGELDGVWAYLTHHGSIISDCILVTTLAPALADEADLAIYEAQGAPPPLTSEFASETAHIANPTNELFRALWSPEGREVLVAIANQPHAYLNAAEELGYTKAVIADGSFGQAWRDFPITHINQKSTHKSFE